MHTGQHWINGKLLLLNLREGSPGSYAPSAKQSFAKQWVPRQSLGTRKKDAKREFRNREKLETRNSKLFAPSLLKKTG
jgi:hypothetical protein